MADEHFFPSEYFSSSVLSAPFLGGASPYAPHPRPGLDVAAAAMAFGMPWADQQQLTADSSGATAAAHFDSALSSLVSSPASAAAGGEDDVAVGDLIGRLGSICNGSSANNSCYSTPLSSPPRGGAPPPAFGRSYAAAALETGRLSRVASSKSLGGRAAAFENSEAETSPRLAGGGNPALPEPTPAKGAASAKKRKAPAKGKAKETSSALPATPASNTSSKRSKVADTGGEGAAPEEKPEPEPVKDYIHVRARRGQATDSHSLAERVRRERISERMKLLQSLVPGCNKITGKALMLDEIINYVQSLQRQVEFLSMKLSTMNPQLDLDGHYLPPKEMNQMAMPGYSSDEPATGFSYTADPFAMAAAAHGLEGLQQACNSFQPGAGFSWEQDLQSMVQMGAGGGSSHGGQPDQPPANSSFPSPASHPHGFYGQQPAAVSHMKVEP